MPKKSKFNMELLKQLSEQYGFKIFNNENEKLTQKSIIKGSCTTEGCNNKFEKGYEKLYLFLNFNCKECVLKMRGRKIAEISQNKSNKEKEEIIKKRQETNNNKTDEEKNEIKQKMEATNMKKFGVKAPAQNAEIAKKCGKNAFKLKPYVLPSGKIINLQGYEHHCIDDLIKKENIDESDILNERDDVPEIWYKDQDNVERRHFVDFFIKSLNKMIEVKSAWTLDKKLDKVFLKQKAAKELGYDYEIRVYSEKGKLLKTYS